MQSTVTKISTSVAYATLACTDLSEAERFYRDSLGFDVERMPEPPGGLMVRCGSGTGLSVYERPTVPNCDATSATFVVPDIHAAMADLKNHGVVFENYDLPYLRTVDGVAIQGSTMAAWFKDPAGNTLSIVQM